MLLLESTPRPARHPAVAAASVAAHAALIALAVAATVRRGDGAPAPLSPADHLIFTLPSRTHDVARPESSGALQNGGTAVVRHYVIDDPIPNTLPPIDAGIAAPVAPSDAHRCDMDCFPRPGDVAGDTIAATDGPRSENEVDKPAVLLPAIAPKYPDMLRQAGVEGRVVAEFVVDTLGRVEMGSVRITSATHPLFASAVTASLSRLRFLPAESAGHRVRQLVRLPFEFGLDRAER